MLIDDIVREPELRAGRVFVYQRNVERTLDAPSLIAVEDAVVRFLGEEIEFVEKAPTPA